MKITFVSNYINHHQIPFCNAMSSLLAQKSGNEHKAGESGGGFTFIQTEKMADERVQMGWNQSERPAYVKCYYEEEEAFRKLIADSDVVIFGGTDDESYIVERLQAGKPVMRYSERLYKTGQWKAISPRGLKKKYIDHTRYRKAPVYLLCAGAYVASDYHIVHAYPGKMYCWGYFPEAKSYDVDKLLREKGYPSLQNEACKGTGDCDIFNQKESCPYLLWAGRMIDWKHPELALETAKYLKEKGLPFHMDIIGGGELYPLMERMLEEYQLQDSVSLLGFKSPEEVRGHMEKADIYLFTSDRQEGWGAVANEAMNSACALVANHMIGAVPYLVKSGENGLIYRDGDKEQLFRLTEKLVKDKALCKSLGKNAYATIANTWNAENGAKQLLELIENVVLQESAERGSADSGVECKTQYSTKPGASKENGGSSHRFAPCRPAPVLSERAGKQLAAWNE